MKGSMQKESRCAFKMDHNIDMVHRFSSMKDLSKGFLAPRSSSSVDETASNSSLSSSCFSLSSAFSSNSASESTCLYNSRSSLVADTEAVPAFSSLSTLREESTFSTNTRQVRNGGAVRQFRFTRLCPELLRSIASFDRHRIVWEEFEDDLYILLDGRLDRLQICRDFYFKTNAQSQGQLGPKRSCYFLLSLGYIFSSKHNNMPSHDEHTSRLASFLSTGRDARQLKLELVRTFYKMCHSTPKNTNNRHVHSSSSQLYEFITDRKHEWDENLTENLSSEAISLVYEIRAKCLRNLDLERDRIKSVTDKGDNTAVIIATGAKILELGIQKSNKAIEGRIYSAGKKVKGWIDKVNVDDHEPKQKSLDNRDTVVVRAISGSTKRASELAMESSKCVAQSTLDTTISGLCTIGNKVEESADKIDQISPEGREIIKAAGKISIASVGAVALVAEAVIESSRSLSSKTVGVTADIVGHKYGSVAGEVARDAADTYTNVLQTMGNITLVSNGSKLVKRAVKNAGKNQIDEDIEKAKEIILSLERHGAIVAKQSLGIQWNAGSLTRELLCASVPGDEKQDPGLIHEESDSSLDKTNSSSGSCDAIKLETMKAIVSN